VRSKVRDVKCVQIVKPFEANLSFVIWYRAVQNKLNWIEMSCFMVLGSVVLWPLKATVKTRQGLHQPYLHTYIHSHPLSAGSGGGASRPGRPTQTSLSPATLSSSFWGIPRRGVFMKRVENTTSQNQRRPARKSEATCPYMHRVIWNDFMPMTITLKIEPTPLMAIHISYV